MNIYLIIAGFSGAVLLVLSFFSSITWPAKLRILAVSLVGVILMGILAWPMIEPEDTSQSVSIINDPSVLINILPIAVIVSALSYFIAWPKGSKVAVAAVPFGLCVWSVNTAQIAEIFRVMDDPQQRTDFYKTMLFDPFLWLIVIAAGLATVYVCGLLFDKKTEPESTDDKSNKNLVIPNFIIGMAACVVAGYFLIPIFVQDVKMVDAEIGWIVAQPANCQIAFGVFAVFACTGFVVRKFLQTHYIAGILAAAILSCGSFLLYVKNGNIEYLTGNWPSVYFSSPHAAILPVQMVAFGTLGSLCGYWLVTVFEIWQRTEHHHLDDTIIE